MFGVSVQTNQASSLNVMTTLILSPFFYPEPISTGKYNTFLAEGLVARGETVDVFCSHPLYPQWHPEISNEPLAGTHIHRGGAWMLYPRSAMIRRLLLEGWFSLFVVWRYLLLRKRPIRLVPIFPPSLFFLALTTLFPRTIRAIGIVHDLQGVYAKNSRGLLGRVVQRSIHFVESRCFSRCDRLVFLSKSMAERAIQEYNLERTKCAVSYPFVALPSHESSVGTNLLTVLPPNKLHLVYSGALGDKQNPNALYEFLAAAAKQNNEIQSHIFSAGPIFDRLRNLHATKDPGLVQFHDLVDGIDVPELYFRSTIQVIPQALGTAEGSLPSKLPNLLAAGVPVMAICEPCSELGLLVKEADAGGVSQSWDIDACLHIFGELLSSIKTESRAARTLRLRAIIEERFSVDRVVDEILRAS